MRAVVIDDGIWNVTGERVKVCSAVSRFWCAASDLGFCARARSEAESASLYRLSPIRAVPWFTHASARFGSSIAAPIGSSKSFFVLSHLVEGRSPVFPCFSLFRVPCNGLIGRLHSLRISAEGIQDACPCEEGEGKIPVFFKGLVNIH